MGRTWSPLARRYLAFSFRYLLALCLPLALAIALAVAAQPHPDAVRYEYLYREGAFVAPHTKFPEGRERGDWSCYDAKTQTTFNCTFVRGGFTRFQYIFRPRR